MDFLNVPARLCGTLSFKTGASERALSRTIAPPLRIALTAIRLEVFRPRLCIAFCNSFKPSTRTVTLPITSLTTDAAGSAGALVVEHRVPGIVAAPNRQLTIRDLLMPGTTDSNAITYVREKGFTNNAGPQASEGAKKAQSDLQFEEVTTSVKTIAHFVKASRQILDDASMLQSYINGRLTYGLKLKEDLQLLTCFCNVIRCRSFPICIRPP